MALEEKHIIFFDGYCNFCNRSVDFFIRHDTTGKFFYSPLQGKTSEHLLPAGLPTNLSSFIYYRAGRIYEKSSAALLACSDLGGGWKLVNVFWIIPRFLRDWVYRLIARNRYRWFGRKETCRIPNASERSKFLD